MTSSRLVGLFFVLCFVALLGLGATVPRAQTGKAQTNDTSLLENLNDGLAGYVMANLIVYGDGSAANGKLSFERKKTWNWKLVLTPSTVNNFHILNRHGAPVFINASAILDDGCWHKTTMSGWIRVNLPPYGTAGGDARSSINDLKVGDTTWLIADNAPNNPIWIDARATEKACSVQ